MASRPERKAPDALLEMLKPCFAQDRAERPTFQQLRRQLEAADPQNYVSYMNLVEGAKSVKAQDELDSGKTTAATAGYSSFSAPVTETEKKGTIGRKKGTYRKTLRGAEIGGAAPSSDSASLEGLQVLSKLGEGSYGAVNLGLLDGVYVAVKRLLLPDSELLSPREKKKRNVAMFQEASIMSKIVPHKNVIGIYGLAQDADSMQIVMEFAARGSLESFVNKHHDKVTETILYRFSLGIARGMASLASQHIIHRDLAARNVLLDSTFEPKISDFGLSRENEQDSGKTTTNVGPIRWMAPENFRLTYSEKSDVWSFGATIVEMLTGTLPYGDSLDLVDVIVGVRDSGWNPIYYPRKIGKDPSQPRWVNYAPDYLVNLLRKCFEVDAANRMPFAEIVSYLLEHMPEEVAKSEARREKRRIKREKVLNAIDETFL